MRVGAHTLENFEKVHKAGVKIAYGTDLAMGHGSNASEAVLMHKHGMSEMDVLVTATINTADMLGMSDELGTIEVGKQADIIATRGSPLENIEELLDVDFVMKGGKVYKSTSRGDACVARPRRPTDSRPQTTGAIAQ